MSSSSAHGHSRTRALDRRAADRYPDDLEPIERSRPEEPRRSWRGWHVIARFLPMVVLGIVFIIIGLSPAAPHVGAATFGFVFVWIGAILIGAAFLGMLFTKCPTCYSTHWVICFQEPDVLTDHGEGDFYRELSPPPRS